MGVGRVVDGVVVGRDAAWGLSKLRVKKNE